jgi:hypothetical protein
MGIRHFLLLLLAANAASACAVEVAAPPKPGPAASDEPLDCESDKDCPVMACGPCTPGSPITHAMHPGPSCAVNPCLDASAVCNAQHRCEIGPGTRRNPSVWNRR